MNFTNYLQYFESILYAEKPQAPYDNPDYFDYAKLNWSRMHRWLKNHELNADLVAKLKAISKPQKWVLICEPWCGDAAHSVPFIVLLSELNPNISLEIQLRDSGSEIDQYLTNGGKSIPKLIVRDENGKDLATWGPRPAECQVIYQDLHDKKTPFEETKIALQKWYNADKGLKIQQELLQLPIF